MKATNMRFSCLLAAAALASGAAQAQTALNVYGLADAYVGRIRNTAGPTRGSANVVNPSGMTTSHFGLRGVEDLGAGVKAVFALETFFRTDTGAFGRFGTTQDLGFTRNAFVGLSGGFGQVTAGRNTTPYFLATILFNPFGDSFAFSPIVSHVFRGDNTQQGFVQGDTAFSNSIRYTTPVFAGFRGDIAYSTNTAGVLVQEDFANRNFGRASDWALTYGQGPLGGALVYRTINLRNGADARQQDSALAATSYDFKVAKLFGQYQFTRDEFSAAARPDARKRTWQLGASVPLGPGFVLASFAQSRFDAGSLDNRRDTYAIGYDYTFSRRTDAYLVHYRDRARDIGNTQSIVALGIRHRF